MCESWHKGQRPSMPRRQRRRATTSLQRRRRRRQRDCTFNTHTHTPANAICAHFSTLDTHTHTNTQSYTRIYIICVHSIYASFNGQTRQRRSAVSQTSAFSAHTKELGECARRPIITRRAHRAHTIPSPALAFYMRPAP